MPEESLERSLREDAVIDRFRMSLGNPTQKEINSVLKRVFLPLRSKLIGEYAGNSEKALEDLSDHKSNSPFLNTKPVLCAHFILGNLGISYNEVAIKAITEMNDAPLFKLFYDFSSGVIFASTRIVKAQEKIAGIERERNKSVTSAVSNILGSTTSRDVESHLRREKEDVELANLLIKDPSGFSIMDDFVNRTKAGLDADILMVHTKEYVLAGAELARDLYKKLYAIAAPLYPEKPSK